MSRTISRSEAGLLCLIAQISNVFTLEELAQAHGSTKGNVQARLKRLKEKGLVGWEQGKHRTLRLVEGEERC